MGPEWTDLDLVFPNMLGKPLDGTILLHYHLYPLPKEAGAPRIRFHDLRHTAATLLLLKNVPAKVVSGLLGHASVAITLDLSRMRCPKCNRRQRQWMRCCRKLGSALGANSARSLQ